MVPTGDLSRASGVVPHYGRPRRCVTARPSPGRATVAMASRQGRVVNWDDIIIDAAATDTGMRRSNNQDSHSVVRASTPETWRQRGHLFMVADGMGAHAVGELASKMACDNIPHNYTQDQDRHVGRGDHQGLPRGRRADPQPRQRQPRLPGDGDDLLDPAAPARGGPDRARRRLARLPDPRTAGSTSSRSTTAWSGSWSGATT